MNIKSIIQGIRCEKCYPRRFGEKVNDSDDNLYLYLDLGGNTRCFCKNHMSYGKINSSTILTYDDDWDYVGFGAKLKSDVIKDLSDEE